MPAFCLPRVTRDKTGSFGISFLKAATISWRALMAMFFSAASVTSRTSKDVAWFFKGSVNDLRSACWCFNFSGRVVILVLCLSLLVECLVRSEWWFVKKESQAKQNDVWTPVDGFTLDTNQPWKCFSFNHSCLKLLEETPSSCLAFFWLNHWLFSPNYQDMNNIK